MTDDALQALGRDIALACLSAMRNLETHGPENQALRAALDRLVALVDVGMKQVGGILRLDVIDGHLVIHGERLRAHGQLLEQYEQVVSLMGSRRVGGVAFSSAQSPKTLLRWFTVLGRRPLDEAAFASLHEELAAIASNGVHALELRTALPVVRSEVIRHSTMAFAADTYARALLAFRDYVRASGEGKDPYAEPLDVVRVVQDLVDVVAARGDLLFQLMSVAVTRSIGRKYSETHAANTCVYALLIGHVLELDRTQLHDLGTSALLAEVSTVLRQDPALDEPVEWSEERRAEQRSDVTRSLGRMLALGDLDDALMMRAVVAEEHRGDESNELHLFARIMAVAGAYDSLTQKRPWRDALSPAEALKTLRKDVDARFDLQVLVSLECVLAGYLGVGAAM